MENPFRILQLTVLLKSFWYGGAWTRQSLVCIHQDQVVLRMRLMLECPPHIIDIKGRWRCENSKFAYAKPSDSRIVLESKVGAMY